MSPIVDQSAGKILESVCRTLRQQKTVPLSMCRTAVLLVISVVDQTHENRKEANRDCQVDVASLPTSYDQEDLEPSGLRGFEHFHAEK